MKWAGVKWVGGLISLACVLASPSIAHAVPPPARTGFQMAVRTGFSLPMGESSDGEDMSDIYSGQVPIFLDIGGKVIPNLFIGGYFGLGFGGAAGRLGDICDAANATCTTVSVRLGVEAQYHFLPAGSANPWLGYGVGFESSGVGISAGGRDGTVTLTGFEFGRFGGGVDFRISRTFGIGPFLDFSVGNYSHAKYDLPGTVTDEGSIANTATHEWLTFGVRGVFFP